MDVEYIRYWPGRLKGGTANEWHCSCMLFCLGHKIDVEQRLCYPHFVILLSHLFYHTSVRIDNAINAMCETLVRICDRAYVRYGQLKWLFFGGS